ncbi:alpha/beta hydrolase family protein [Nocardia neocaledoniensis]|uniref:alpha/beta hydrolase family protein n=1 Tax=Nocardia neocaledoniensis TaxID=236511 RepID=UPI00313BE944
MARIGNRRMIVATALAVCTVGLGIRAAELSAPAESVFAAETVAVPRTPVRIAYGAAADTFGDLYLPPTSRTRLPVVVLIHGGGWAQNRSLGQFDAHARALAAEGVAVWNIEYRRVGGEGGWPTTLTDVAAAVEALAETVAPRVGHLLDLQRVHIAGHSAGGQLAAWVAGRSARDHPAIRIRSLTLMAAVLDMELAVTEGRDAFVPKLLGGTPAEVPDRYREASPIHHLPGPGLRVTALHGERDRVVAPVQSRRYVDALRRIDVEVDLQILPAVGHAEFADATSPAWKAAHRSIIGHATAVG